MKQKYTYRYHESPTLYKKRLQEKFLLRYASILSEQLNIVFYSQTIESFTYI